MSYPGQPQQPQQPFPGGGYPQQQGKGSIVGGVITAIAGLAALITVWLEWMSPDLTSEEEEMAEAQGIDVSGFTLWKLYDDKILESGDDNDIFFVMIAGAVLALVGGLIALAAKKSPLMISGVVGILGAGGIGYATIRAYMEVSDIDGMGVGLGGYLAIATGVAALVGAVMSLAASSKAPQ